MAQKETSIELEQFDWVNVKEACELLGISRLTLHRLVKENFLPAYRIKGVRSYQFKREDVLDLIEQVKPEDFNVDDDK